MHTFAVCVCFVRVPRVCAPITHTHTQARMHARTNGTAAMEEVEVNARVARGASQSHTPYILCIYTRTLTLALVARGSRHELLARTSRPPSRTQARHTAQRRRRHDTSNKHACGWRREKNRRPASSRRRPTTHTNRLQTARHMTTRIFPRIQVGTQTYADARTSHV